MSIAPCSIKKAQAWVKAVHRRLPKIQGGLWAVKVLDDGEMVGVAIVGWPARKFMEDGVLGVLRCAVLDGHKNACSMLYGACSRAAKAMGATDLVTYTHADEAGTSLKASGWVYAGMTDGGEYSRPSRARPDAVDPMPKHRWFAAWGRRAKRVR